MTDSKFIYVKGARVHNLKNIDVKIPRGKLVVVSGLSGSGKSTLAFDTIFAEGQRRYVESLSSYARQFLGRISKPEVDFIEGIPPAIAIEQKVNTRNPRSTVGTSTEIYDYLKLLYARVGKTYSPVSGKEVKVQSVTDVVDFICSRPEGERMLVLAPIHLSERQGLAERFTLLVEQGFSRVEVDGEQLQLTEALPMLDKLSKASIFLIVDRIAVATDTESQARFGDSIQTAFSEGHGECVIALHDAPKGKKQSRFNFSTRFELDGLVFEQPTEHLFSFNNPLGACPLCEGYGKVIGIDEDLVVPDRSLSVYSDAVACWKGDTMKAFKEKLIAVASKFDFPIHRSYSQLSNEERELLWNGNKHFTGINGFFEQLEKEKYKIQYRVLISRYTGKTLCPECKGSRLRKEAGYVKVGGESINDLVLLPIERLSQFFTTLKLDEHDKRIAGRALVEIESRLQFLLDVGLGYLTLNRLSSTLSGGESQRINLATSLGSSLVGSLYILDEPSIGLHPRDTQRLIKVLEQLRDLGNTVLVVEHEEEIIRAADEIIDIGPLAGRFGGEVVYQGAIPTDLAPKEKGKKATKNKNGERSLTLKYLSGEEKIEVPAQRRQLSRYIEVLGARENNLKNVNVRIPLNGIVAVTGVSGSGKSSLVRSILYPALSKLLNMYGDKAGKYDSIGGDLKLLKAVEMVDQNPIGRSSRSNPVTYIKAYDEIRKLYSEQPYAKRNGYTPSHFSFNIDGGRCEECQGDGFIKMEMQFMSDVTLVCESCGGKRFKQDILEVRYKDLNISDVLDLSVSQAIEFFNAQKEPIAKRVAERLKPLQDVGLDYVKLGQSSSTLSGGESQRVKLAFFLSKESGSQHTLFIFDEPTTGLHFHDIRKLMAAMNALVDKGHSVVLVEHNMEVIKSADWVIDLGPEGGEKGGTLVFEGLPEELVKCKKSYTGKYLKEKL